ncbi:hypothetical protein LIER_10115 [Lithospermum erythrorhizon]|uniref:Disease resistance protein winged helix domain-containing protein n=1 Tax=Lithospermum erythrorhizon TaxID=34254 RepID=A0AAV3PI18_LITER
MEDVKQQLFPHLFISYREFPSRLKRCFILCASFPKDYIFDVKDELIFLWMSRGYLNQGNKDEEVEQIGQEYSKILVSRSFLQETT